MRQTTPFMISYPKVENSKVETLPMIIYLLTPDYRVVSANRTFRQNLGEFGGRCCYEYFFDYDKPCTFCESFIPLKTGQPHHWKFTSPDKKATIDAYDFPFADLDGSPLILQI
jgi:hypothetical protein